MKGTTPADKFYAYLEDWALRQRAQHGEDVAKERLRAYLDGVNDSIKVVGEFGPAGLEALYLVTALVQSNALSVECPTCGAEIGDLCWSSTRVGRKISQGSHHPDRVRVARGEHVPQNLDAWLGRRRQQVAAEAAAKAGKKKP
jgi:hypothetical protein